MSHAGNFSTDKFNQFLSNTDVNFGKLKEDKISFMDLERRLWMQLAESDSDVSEKNYSIRTLKHF